MVNRRRQAAVATATIVALAGCEPGMPTAAPVGVDAPAMLSAVIDQVYGTPQQRLAGEERMWLTSQSAIAACARTKGVVYGVTPYQPMSPSTDPAPGDLLGFAPHRADFGVAARIEMLAKRGETPNPGLPAAADDQARWFTAVESCQNAATAGEKLRVPDGQQELEVELVELLGSVQQQAAPDLTRQYAGCMKSAGIDAGDLSEAYLKVEQRFPPVSFERPSDPTALPEWAGAVAFEKKVAAADWACRESRLDGVVNAAAGDLQKFTTTNTARIARVADGWKAMPGLARTLRATVKATPAK
ncbi:hypothetical protein O7602_09000 [Micromonospora sp. WMMD1128]|uniref:hypothetical protein n=1 Tax=Micromonospora sp. WMMD1128 TaxID=3015150 RepID=UPI00248AE077|nr:hypothetical protein [Micromonospora sp. WMMD1128]WBB75621.1 hypothetical protein O7602_09000 [Micromonospora sp. WMMD1128]